MKTDESLPKDDLESPAPESFAVRDAASANWVIRKIVEARDYAARVKVWAELELRRAQRQEQFWLDRYGLQLEDWAREQIAAQADRRRSVNLPAGTIGFRSTPNRLSVLNEKRLLAWCRQHLPSAIQVMESVSKSSVADHLKTTGECVDGVELVGKTERFHISAKILNFVEGDDQGHAE